MKNINVFFLTVFICIVAGTIILTQCKTSEYETDIRQRISINEDWSFFKYDSVSKADMLVYDVRPDVNENDGYKIADAKPTEAVEVKTAQEVLKPWILPSGNSFIKDPTKWHVRPEGNPGSDFPFVQENFDDSSWEKVNLPHDWAIKGPFQTGWNTEVGGGMGRLPVNGVAWYRKKLDIPASDTGKSIFLDIDGAMSYAIVWLNGNLVGGWPYGYNSWRLDLTPYVKPGGENQLAIRLDNPNHSARWYPGAGLYRNVWLTKTNPVHVAQWGTYVTSKDISKESATINFSVTIDNDSKADAEVEVSTSVYGLDSTGNKSVEAVAIFPKENQRIEAGGNSKTESSVILKNPKLWGPLPTQQPHLYIAVTTLLLNGKPIDTYETRFGIRTLEFNPDKGVFVNDEHIQIKLKV